MSTRSSLESFSEAGILREVRGDRPLLLEADRLWVVRSGRIDVFATQVQEGEPVGCRTHLFRVEAGGALVGAAETAGTVMLGVGAPETTVTEVELGPLKLVEPSAAPYTLGELAEGWIEHLYEALTVEVPTSRYRTIEPGGPADVEPEALVRPTEPVAWLELVAGSACLLGLATGLISAGALVPLTQKAWVKTSAPSTLRLRGTDEQLQNDATSGTPRAWRALGQLNGMVLQLVAERQREAEVAQHERAQRRMRASEATMSTVVSKLAATITKTPERTHLSLHPMSGDETEAGSLFPAFRLVAAANGMDLSDASGTHEQIAPRDAVHALAHSHRLRTRRVALHHGWWKQDGEPLLAVLADRPRPVALLPGSGGYKLVDPYDRTQRRVTAAVAAQLGRFAYVVYRPFGAEPLHALRLLRFGMHRSRRDLVMVGVMGVAVALLGLVPPLAIGALYNTVIPGAQRGQLAQLTLGLVVCALAVAAFETVRGVAVLRIEGRVGPGLQAAVWDRLLTLPLPFFRQYTAGDLATRAMGVEEMRSIASGTVITILLSGVLSLANIALLFYYDFRLAWIGIALIGVGLAVSWALSYLQIRQQRLILPLRSRIAGVVHQLLMGISKLKAAGAEVYGFGLWAHLFSKQRRLQFRARTLRNAQIVVSAMFPLLATLVLFHAVAGQSAISDADTFAGERRPLDAMMRTGDFLAFIAAFNLALTAMLSSSTALVGALAIVPLYEQLKPILDAAPEVHTGKRDPGELSGAIELQHVTFRYQPDVPPALHDVSIRVRPGEFVALVGPSGSGKSTILRLLLGFELPEAGSVAYDEQDLRGLDPEAVRQQIGVVTQDGRLMPGDIFTNIVGSSAVGIEAAWEAARMAGLDEDIRRTPMGMHTVVSDGGGTFSGGQRQRLMIARALLHRPRIVFFDEATSALDNRMQDIVSRSLLQLKATRIVVAHRLSTIRNADRVYVIQAGRLVEAGTFEDLLAGGGEFGQIARRQLV